MEHGVNPHSMAASIVTCMGFFMLEQVLFLWYLEPDLGTQTNVVEEAEREEDPAERPRKASSACNAELRSRRSASDMVESS